MLTPVDIETVEFKKVALGYSVEEVDDFLDKVIVEFERLYKDNMKQRDKINVLNEGLQYYKSLEDTLRNSIVLAEKTASETKYNASQNSEQIIKEAQLKASEILQNANQRLYELEFDVLKMKNQYTTLKTKLRLLLTTELEILENSDDGLDEKVRAESVSYSSDDE